MSTSVRDHLFFTQIQPLPLFLSPSLSIFLSFTHSNVIRDVSWWVFLFSNWQWNLLLLLPMRFNQSLCFYAAGCSFLKPSVSRTSLFVTYFCWKKILFQSREEEVKKLVSFLTTQTSVRRASVWKSWKRFCMPSENCELSPLSLLSFIPSPSLSKCVWTKELKRRKVKRK